jgi:hypothetical protein
MIELMLPTFLTATGNKPLDIASANTLGLPSLTEGCNKILVSINGVIK